MRDVLRIQRYAYRTEESYLDWVRRYILFHDKRHPQDMAEAEMEAFLGCSNAGPFSTDYDASDQALTIAPLSLHH